MRCLSRLLPLRSWSDIVASVPPASPAASQPTPAVGPALKPARTAASYVSEVPGPVPGVDFVPTECLPAPSPSKGQGRWLRAGVDRQRVMGWAVREKVVQLHVFEGKSLRETARLVGRSYKRISSVWAAICREVNGGKATPEAHREAVRGYLDKHYRRVMEGAQGLLGDAAAYGAVVVAAGKALAELHGIKPEDALPAGFSLEDVGREVRVVSPLLIDRLDQVRALGGAAGDPEASRAAANARWAKVREVPVEGAPVCPVADPSPEVSTCDNLSNAESAAADAV